MPVPEKIPETMMQPHYCLPGVPYRTPVHPGYFLQTRYFAPLGLNQTEAAHILGISRRRINEIILGRRSLSPDTALRCASYLGADAVYLMSLQTAWDVFQTWKKLRKSADLLPPALECAKSVIPRRSPGPDTQLQHKSPQ